MSNSRFPRFPKSQIVITPTLLVVLALAATAQTRIDGRVVTTDSIPVHNAIVQLRMQDDSTKVYRATTDSEGRFSFFLTSIEHASTASGYALHPNYPNPFSSSTTITFSIPQRESVTLVVHDLLGRHVRTLVSEQVEAGTYRVVWDGRNESGKFLPHGSYLCILRTRDGVASKRLLFSGKALGTQQSTSLARTGDVVILSKESAAQQVLIEVRDTTVAMPRITSQTFPYSIGRDTSITATVNYGGWEDLEYPSKGVRSLFLDDPYLYVCSGQYGLWRRDIEKLTPWQYLGLADTSPKMGWGVVDVDASGDHILVAYYGRRVTGNLDSMIAVWRSTDAGQTWLRSDSGITDTMDPNIEHNFITLIKRSPHKKNVVLAQYFYAALYRSLDSGRTWKKHRGSRGVISGHGHLKWNTHWEGEVWELGTSAVDIHSMLTVYENYGDSARRNIEQNRIYPSVFDADNKYHAFAAWYSLAETTDGGISWFEHEAHVPGIGRLLVIEATEALGGKRMFLFVADEFSPPHNSYIAVRSFDQNDYRILTKLPTVGNNLFVDKRNYLYWNWAGYIRRMYVP